MTQTVKEYADSQQISVQAVYKQIRQKKVRFKKVGSVYLITEPQKQPVSA